MYNCNNANSCNNISCPELTINMTANANQLAPCDLITYTVTITNQDNNVTYGVLTLDATISTEYTSNNLKINTIQKSCTCGENTSTTKSVEITESNTSNEDDVIIIE